MCPEPIRIPGGSLQNVRIVEGAIAPPFLFESSGESGLAGLARTREHDRRHDGKTVLQGFHHEPWQRGIDHIMNDNHS